MVCAERIQCCARPLRCIYAQRPFSTGRCTAPIQNREIERGNESTYLGTGEEGGMPCSVWPFDLKPCFIPHKHVEVSRGRCRREGKQAGRGAGLQQQARCANVTASSVLLALRNRRPERRKSSLPPPSLGGTSFATSRYSSLRRHAKED